MEGFFYKLPIDHIKEFLLSYLFHIQRQRAETECLPQNTSHVGKKIRKKKVRCMRNQPQRWS